VNKWLVVAVSGIILVITGGVVLSLRNQTPAVSQVEHRGNRLIIYGHGEDADLGYLPAGRYELTIDENRGGCANRVTLDGEDGTRWLDLDPHTINYKDFATTREMPGQRYSMHISTGFTGGGLGPRPTPSPVSTCSWILELAPA
jgi:hypothetical protein